MWRVIVMMIVLPGVALADDGPAPAQLKKMYEDALVQLRSAQDRKNELANENEKLNAKIAELNKTIDANRATIDQMKADAIRSAELTYTTRAKLAAWEAFIRRDPRIAARWGIYLENAMPVVETADAIIDRDWPMSTVNASMINPGASRSSY